MKKLFRMLSLALALSAALCIPVSAATVLTGDSFSNNANAGYWQTDRYEPDGFEYANGRLYLVIGEEGYTSRRPQQMQGSYYALQGRRLAVSQTTGSVWTATVKINLDESWSDGARRRAEFRVDAVGTDSGVMPAMAVACGSSGNPVIQYANPAVKSGWSSANKYYDSKDEQYVSLDFEEGWHTLLIKANGGMIYYYLDDIQIASAEFADPDTVLTPSSLALNAQNYGSKYEVCFDSCYLYDGGYSVYKPSQESRERAEDRKAERYQQKRENWRERHTVYKFDGSDREYTRQEAKAAGLDVDDAVSSRLDREMPDSYWDY